MQRPEANIHEFQKFKMLKEFLNGSVFQESLPKYFTFKYIAYLTFS